VAPFIFAQIKGIDLILGRRVGGKVREHQKGLVVAEQALDDGLGVIRASGRKEPDSISSSVP